MKIRLASFIVLFFAAQLAFAQKAPLCGTTHSSAAPGRMAALVSNRSFRMSHPVPAKMRFQSSMAKSITYKTSDGKTASAMEWKAAKPTKNYLLVIHEWWGLNDQVKAEAEKLFTTLGNVNVIALDLYDGKSTSNRDEAGKLMQGASQDRIISIVKGALAYAGPSARIGTIGWCFGGAWSLQSALLAGKQEIACVMYYGMPEQDVNRLKTLNSDVLGIFGNKDKFINPKVVSEFKANMAKAGKKLVLKQYDADHGFANPSNPIYDKLATADAWKNTIAYLKPKFK
ncbi:MAG: dienelactone hydrolase family protein [Mucilaginibacter polytrichastri]|nr:dienelactone hydrolase family protein [Mucilaginibacter polytrichastri]